MPFKHQNRPFIPKVYPFGLFHGKYNSVNIAIPRKADESKEAESMNYKKLSTIIFMVSGVAMVAWGVLANDWSKCWLAVVVGGVLGTIVGMLGKTEKKEK